MTPSALPHRGCTIPALLLCWLTLVLGGCSAAEEAWNGKDIQGLMPELEFQLTGTSGEQLTAADFAGQVRLLDFGFTSCPDVCPATLSSLNKAVSLMPEDLRNRVTILFVSVDPERDTGERIQSYVQFFGSNIVGLTGPEPSLRALTRRYRTTFGYEEADANGNYQVSHSAAVYVFDRQDQARLLLRPDLTPQQIAEDLTRLAR